MTNRRLKVGAALAAALALGSPVGAADRDSQKIERLEQQIEELRREVQELKKQKREPEAAAKVEAPAPAPIAEGALAAIRQRVQIGGYGSVRFEGNSADGQKATFELRRLVLTADAAIAPRLRSYFELEFERFRELELERKLVDGNGGLQIEQAIEGTNESEIALEQAWVEFELARLAKVRAGAVLVPLGRFNLNHDDNRWDLPRRSLIDRGAPVLPVKAAWDEVGAGLNGDVEIGDSGSLGYQFYVVNGAVIQPEVETELESPNAEGGRELVAKGKFKATNGTFGRDFKDAKAFAGRVLYSPSLGQEIAGSFYHGRYTPDSLPDESVTAFGVDALSIWGPFELEGEYLFADYGNVTKVARGLAKRLNADGFAIESEELESVMEFELDSLPEQKHGYWIEARYRFRPDWLKESILGSGFDDPVLTAVIRGEQVFIDNRLDELAFSEGLVTENMHSDRRLDRLTIGGSYRPVPLVAFQLAYEYTHVDEGGLGDVTNFMDTGEDHAHAVLLGAAFGF